MRRQAKPASFWDMRQVHHRVIIALGLGPLVLCAGCPVEGATGSHSIGADGSQSSVAAVADAGLVSPPMRPVPRLEVTANAPRRAEPPIDASAPAPAAPEDPTNRVKPLDEARWLDTQGRALLAAMASGDARQAEGFFFPRAPFSRLKRAGNPDGYWLHLSRLFAEDLARLRRRHADWAGAAFESLTLAAPPQWVAPGEEHNHIGYHRSRYARLRYAHGGQRYSVFVHTLITWQGRWYVTHLGPPRPLGARPPRPASGSR